MLKDRWTKSLEERETVYRIMCIEISAGILSLRPQMYLIFVSAITNYQLLLTSNFEIRIFKISDWKSSDLLVNLTREYELNVEHRLRLFQNFLLEKVLLIRVIVSLALAIWSWGYFGYRTYKTLDRV